MRNKMSLAYEVRKFKSRVKNNGCLKYLSGKTCWEEVCQENLSTTKSSFENFLKQLSLREIMLCLKEK